MVTARRGEETGEGQRKRKRERASSTKINVSRAEHGNSGDIPAGSDARDARIIKSVYFFSRARAHTVDADANGEGGVIEIQGRDGELDRALRSRLMPADFAK